MLRLSPERLKSLVEDARQERIAREGGNPRIRLHPRQQEFTDLECEEGLFGGCTGGGKTFWLLDWLGEGSQIPEFSGLFLRRTFSQLEKSNDSAISKSFEIFGPLGGKYNSTKYRWKFPSGATIEFGHMQHVHSKENYQGGGYHRVAYDEITQFTEEQYTYLFSRMRKKVGFPLPMGIRCAGNPGGIGHPWVKKRFITPEAEKMVKALDPREPTPAGAIFWATPKRAFLPSRLADNPSLDVDDYIDRMLLHLPPVLRMQLVNGDWSAVEGSVIDPAHLRYYTMRGDIIQALDAEGGKTNIVINCHKCNRFATIDTAGTSKQKAQEDKGKPASWSVCMVWDYYPKIKHLYLRHVWRARVGWNDLVKGCRQTLQDWKVPLAIVEKAHFGEPLANELGGVSSKRLVNPTIPGMKAARSGDVKAAKLERATAAGLFKKLAKAEVYLPEMESVEGVAAWMPEFESELLSWTGRPDETADQIDTFSYACHHVGTRSRSWGGPVW